MALSKRATSSSTVLLSGAGERIKASIATENISHILSRLTDLYTNPLEAAVREIVSNGIDATLELPEAQRLPLQVTSPSTFVHQLVIQDHGVGMSRETVEKVSASYGATTKSDNLALIGSYGLGSKAPLAYTDSFSVRTVKDGVATEFTMQRSGYEVETVLRPSEPTTEGNGTRVTIPINGSDLEAVEEILKNYKNRSWALPMEIDGELYFGNQDFWDLGEIEIYRDNDTTLYGHLRVHTKKLSQVFTYAGSDYRRFSYPLGLTVGNWVYPVMGSIDPDILLELKPAVVDFSSSRDSVTANEKLEALISHISAQLRGNKAIMDRIFEIFDELSPEDAVAFVEAVRPVDVRENSITYGTWGRAFDKFKGNNKLLFVLRDTLGKKLINLSFSIPRKSSRASAYGIIHSSYGGGLKFGSHQHLNALKSLRDEFERNSLRYGLAAVVNFALATNRPRLMLVTSVTPKNFRAILRRRDFFMNQNTIAMVSAFKLSDFPEEELEFARHFLGDHFVLKTTSQIMKETEEAAKAQLEANKLARQEKKAWEKTYTVYTVNGGPYQNNADFCNAMGKYQVINYRTMTLKEIFKDGGHLVVAGSRGLWSQTFIGAVNQGKLKFSDKIVFMDNDLKAEDYRALEEYKDQVFFHKNMAIKIRSKAAEETIKGRTFGERVLKESLYQEPEENLWRVLLQKKFFLRNYNHGVIAHLEQLLRDPMAKKWANIHLEALKNSSGTFEDAEARVELERRGLIQELKSAERYFTELSKLDSFSAGDAALLEIILKRVYYVSVDFGEALTEGNSPYTSALIGALARELDGAGSV